MASVVPNVLLNNGKNMPILGLGTWNVVLKLYSLEDCIIQQLLMLTIFRSLLPVKSQWQ